MMVGMAWMASSFGRHLDWKRTMAVSGRGWSGRGESSCSEEDSGRMLGTAWRASSCGRYLDWKRTVAVSRKGCWPCMQEDGLEEDGGRAWKRMVWERTVTVSG